MLPELTPAAVPDGAPGWTDAAAVYVVGCPHRWVGHSAFREQVCDGWADLPGKPAAGVYAQPLREIAQMKVDC